jgi:aminoglycoside phosphotransferase (APT) family kinase protein
MIDLERLACWMDSGGLATGPITGVERLAGGTQNLVLRFVRGGQRFVMRRPPFHPRPGNDELMRREARLLAALADTDVPHPKLIKGCGDPAALGYAFYLMEEVNGFNPQLGMPAYYIDAPAIRREMGFAALDALVRLGRVDPDTVGLAGFGQPSGFLERQVKRWYGQFARYSEVREWPGASALPGVDAVAEWLEPNRPGASVPGIMHGDYHIANLMFHNDRAEVAAIVDWEMATVGDPLIDLGWLLATWPEQDGHGVGPSEGLPSAAELLARYARTASRDVAHIDWYVTFARFKLAIVLEGTHVRACAGKADAAMGRRLHETARSLMAKASGQIGSGR